MPVVAIDGVSASGKGTLAHKLSEHYQVSFLPTGNIYRYVAKQMLLHRCSHEDKTVIKKIVRSIVLEDLYSPELNSDILAAEASKIAKLQFIRDELNQFQRNWIKSQKLAIIEGRDIGTVICPEADVKLFLMADLATRAKRRAVDLNMLGVGTTYEQVYAELAARDSVDISRKNAPLKKADDAIEIDTSLMSVEGVLERMLKSIL